MFAGDEHVQVQATWGIYQRPVGAYRATAEQLLDKLIVSLRTAIPAALIEVASLGRTLNKRADNILAYLDRPGTSNGTTEAMNGRLEHLRGSAFEFRNLTNCVVRSLLTTGGFRARLHPAS